MNESTASPVPERIGPYRILSELGQGGMGRVFLAEQQDPQRQVALKVLSSTGPDLERRFRRESQVLAALEHPNIARAVHFAHTRGVIHRDLKPANILVDARGEPRILDFGVARVVTEDSATRVTHAGEIIGTVPYMSWEQLVGDTGQADPRSDVYSLGVIAYELLAGHLPYEGLESGTLVTALELLSRATPRRVSASQPAARGDLETLVHKAIARDVDQRYQSAAELADDIDRLLDRRPIQARPPSIGYVTGLFVRRHKLAAGAALAIVLSLVVATAVSVRFAVSEAQARLVAESRLAEREAVNTFLNEMLVSADPERTLGERLAVVDVLDVAKAEFASNERLSPAVQAQLGRTLGNTYVALGRYDEGIGLLDRALEAARDSAARDRLLVDKASAEVIAARLDAASTTLDAISDAADQRIGIEAAFTRGRIDLEAGRSDEAVTKLRATYDQARAALGPDDDLTLAVGQQLMVALVRMGDNEASLAVGTDVAQRLEARLGRDNPRTVVAWDGVALNYRDQARFDESIALLAENHAIYERVLGPEHPQTLMTGCSLAAVYAMAGQPEAGVALVQKGHEQMRALLGDEAEVVRTLASLRGYVASEAGDYAQAVKINRLLVTQSEAKPGGPEINDLVDYNNLGNNLRKLGQSAEAVQVFNRLLELAGGKLSQDHLHYGLFAGNYGKALIEHGEVDRARPVLERACDVVGQHLGAEHPRTQAVCTNPVLAEG